jgi:dTDP-4-dehydrorhamnose reductase
VTRTLVTGAHGQLGREIVDAFAPHEVLGVGPRECDVRDRDAVLGLVTSWRPDLIVHAAAWTDVDGCEGDPDRAYAVNALGTRHVAEGARLTGAYLCLVSTDYVFDGDSSRPYLEWDPPGPVNVYGASKRAAELEALSVPGACVVRTSWLCGAHGRNFVATMVGRARAGGEVRVVADQHGCPTFADELAGAIRRLAVARRPGVFHVTNQGPTTWYELARATFAAAGHDPDRVLPVATDELDPPRPARRPRWSVLDNAALRLSGLPLLSDYHEPLERLVKELTA